MAVDKYYARTESYEISVRVNGLAGKRANTTIERSTNFPDALLGDGGVIPQPDSVR